MMRCGYFDTTRKGNHSATSHQQWLMGDAPFPLKSALKVTHPFEKRRLRPISAYNVSTVRDSEESSSMTNIKSTMALAQKAIFSFFGIKVKFSRIKSATKFLCVKTSSSKVVVQPFPCLVVHRY